MTVSPHQQRVVDEKIELDAKISRLYSFMGSPEFTVIVNDVNERSRLTRQLDIMNDYSSILAHRIAAFPP